MMWATREACLVDRTACAWLIRRFLDPKATFVFVADPADVPPGATPFDMRGVELGHRNGGCSFETFLDVYALDDPALRRLAEVVHEADLGDERYDAPEAEGLDADVRAAVAGRSDEERLVVTAPLYDALYDRLG